MYEINIEQGKKIFCPTCNSVIAIKNDNEILYRNVVLIYQNKKTGQERIKCKQCKTITNKMS